MQAYLHKLHWLPSSHWKQKGMHMQLHPPPPFVLKSFQAYKVTKQLRQLLVSSLVPLALLSIRAAYETLSKMPTDNNPGINIQTERLQGDRT
eukprot:339818-Amphidinium_carterae.1